MCVVKEYIYYGDPDEYYINAIITKSDGKHNNVGYLIIEKCNWFQFPPRGGFLDV